MLAPWKESYDKPREYVKKQRPHFANKGPYNQSYSFSSSHVWMWELDHEEGWALKNWCFQTVVLEKTLESSLDCKEIKPVNLKGNQPWMFIGRTDPEAETRIFWPPDEKSWLIGKDPDAGKIEGKKRRMWQKLRRVESITDSMDMNLRKFWEILEDRGPWQASVHGITNSQTWFSDSTTMATKVQSQRPEQGSKWGRRKKILIQHHLWDSLNLSTCCHLILVSVFGIVTVTAPLNPVNLLTCLSHHSAKRKHIWTTEKRMLELNMIWEE